jgi:hypothetical protein
MLEILVKIIYFKHFIFLRCSIIKKKGGMKMEKESSYDVTLEELKKQLSELGEWTESGLCEVLGHDSFYFPVYQYDEFYQNDHESIEIIGYFIIYLKDGIAFLPFDRSTRDGGCEQLLEEGFRYVNEEDYELLLSNRKWLYRSIHAIEQTIESMKLKLVAKRGITKEQTKKDLENKKW